MGASSPSAAATNVGAAMAASEITSQSPSSRFTPYPRLVLNIRMTTRTSGAISCAVSAMWMLPTSSCCINASPAAPARPAARSTSSSMRSARIERTPRMAAMSGPTGRRPGGTMTVTRAEPGNSVLTRWYASGSWPHTV